MKQKRRKKVTRQVWDRPVDELLAEAACALGEFTTKRLAAQVQCSARTAQRWACRALAEGRIERAGYVRRQGPPVPLYRWVGARRDDAAATPGPASAPAPDAWASAWAVVREHPRFSAAKVARATGWSLRQAAAYCETLARAGYLRRLHGGVLTLWELVRPVGPQPPIIGTSIVVMDNNGGLSLWIGLDDEEVRHGTAA